MKELLFGWITKGQYNLSFLDSIVALIEILLLFFTIIAIINIYLTIKEFINKFKNKEKE